MAATRSAVAHPSSAGSGALQQALYAASRARGATPLNVYRFAKQAERAGIGCASFDDRMPLNRATAYAVPGVMSKERMIDNIHAAVDGRTDMVLIVRCLAPTPNGSYTEMLDRAAAYAEAGADAIWLGLRTPQDYARAADMVKKPLMAVVGNANIPATPPGEIE